MFRLTLTIISALIVGAAAFFGVEQYTQATTASSITAHDADVNADGRVSAIDLSQVAQRFNQVAVGARPVAEQNLDANGNIKVHEQGVVDVNVSQSGRIIPIVTGATALNNQTSMLGEFVDVSDCMKLDAYISATVSNQVGASNWISARLEPSPDGVTAFLPSSIAYPGWIINISGGENGMTKHGTGRFGWNNGDPASPYVRLFLVVSNADAIDITAQLYCTS